MVRKIDQKTFVRELSISFLQPRGDRNKALEWIVNFVMIQAKLPNFIFACSHQSIVIKQKFRPKNALFLLKNPENRWGSALASGGFAPRPHSHLLISFVFPDFS